MKQGELDPGGILGIRPGDLHKIVQSHACIFAQYPVHLDLRVSPVIHQRVHGTPQGLFISLHQDDVSGPDPEFAHVILVDPYDVKTDILLEGFYDP
jgi:hypothetical protein